MYIPRIRERKITVKLSDGMKYSLIAILLFSFTALQAQVKGTVKDNLGDPIAGANLFRQGTTQGIDGMNDFHLFSRKDSVKKIRIDDYMEWGMLGWVFVCDLMGKEKHNWVDQLCLVAIAEGFNAAMTRTVKYTVGEIRPDGGPHSFPSGHTANAFLGAHVAWKEFKDSCPVLAYSGYALATFVACSRLYNNRHWVADVIAGAGFGILSVELAYLTYFPIRNEIGRAHV